MELASGQLLRSFVFESGVTSLSFDPAEQNLFVGLVSGAIGQVCFSVKVGYQLLIQFVISDPRSEFKVGWMKYLAFSFRLITQSSKFLPQRAMPRSRAIREFFKAFFLMQESTVKGNLISGREEVFPKYVFHYY